MKKIILQGLTCIIYCMTLAQTDQEPCCSILNIDKVKNLVTVQNNSTRQLYYFKPLKAEMGMLKMNEPVRVSSGMITSVGKTKKTYALVQPDYGEPCCGVVTVQPDPGEPCCNIVTFKNNRTGSMSSFTIQNDIGTTIKPGHPIYTDATQNLAIIQFSQGSSGGSMNVYGFPIIDGQEAPADNKWDNKPVKGLKKATGRLNLNFPKDAQWSIDIYSGNKFLINKSIETWKMKYYDLPVGIYNIKLNTVMIENVNIEEGKETQLRAGLLDVKNNDWELRSHDDKKFLTSGNRSRLLVLPEGSYTLEEGRGNKRTVEVNHVVNPEVFTKKTGDFPLWVIMKSEAASELTEDKGLLSISNIPKDTTINYTTPDGQNHSIKFRLNIQANIRAHYDDSVILPQAYVAGVMTNNGMYYFPRYVSVNNAPYGQVPVFPNLETRLKVGFLIITKKKEEDLNDHWLYEQVMGTNQTGTYTWELKNAANQKILSGKKSTILALPPGEYILKKNPPPYSSEDRVFYSVTIKENEWVKNGDKWE